MLQLFDNSRSTGNVEYAESLSADSNNLQSLSMQVHLFGALVARPRVELLL
jgi:hypothetical protein